MRRFTDLVGNYMPLKDYTDTELYKFLDENESTEPRILACICSEILRRENEQHQLKIKCEK